ncbi:phospholipase C, phosphocholine-specific [Chitinophaga silvatica]|uniref:phospholipase C n=1 Tax=Chitinophaga silvatica TaxID=2282649 RepID=A0A3E1Y4T9_9BACT|nr:phospholipase C, phosphocholine-specific [Chitinophaga silvatica]RFS19699.1 phospholipase C, phosphocholine-specific [Chitinophaga silvatica]
MDNRREFLKKAALLSGAAGVFSALPASIQRAMAIDPQPGSTYLDAEHIVVLMQENRSFDHCYGTLRGVRGYNDPRAIQLANKNLVWLQSNARGETFAPFRLNIKETKATWMSSLPHSWTNQVDARNNGRYDQWLLVKQSGNKDWAPMPLTLGYYDRQDIPFYYSMADAFTVCDQNFCSSLTGTTPNRLYLWTGTIRDEKKANVWNSDVDYDKEASWTTFPERLEDNNISWKIYQNELSITELEGDKDGWLANFTDNPIEWFSAFNVKFSKGYKLFLNRKIKELPGEIAALETQVKSVSGEEATKLQKKLQSAKDELVTCKRDLEQFTAANFAKLSKRSQNLHNKAFTTNEKDPDYHELETLSYKDGDTDRTIQIPKGDIFHQFRTDVNEGQLPTVSWLVAPAEFSDHPGSPWYGAWYVSEVLDILTRKEEVWKKTIFILCYDENDGYFDHVPPFVIPHRPGTGKVSAGINTQEEYETKEEEISKKYISSRDIRESSIGLGYRVPLLIASPWSRGGYVNSQVFDHTSILQFMEHFLQHKTGKPIKETNITNWRRTVCGDLSSVFRPFNGEKIDLPFLGRNEVIESIYNAKFKKLPDGFKSLSPAEIAEINQHPENAEWMPKQEPGTRVANALPYELYVNGKLSADKKSFDIQFSAGNKVFGKKAAGSPFNVYAPGNYRQENGQTETLRAWSYAVKAGDKLKDSWQLQEFGDGHYHLRAYGPNGFYREFIGDEKDPQVAIVCGYQPSLTRSDKLTGSIELKISNQSAKQVTVKVKDLGYKNSELTKTIAPNATATMVLDWSARHGWYDFAVTVNGSALFSQRFAGRVETGKESVSDPLMARS